MMDMKGFKPALKQRYSDKKKAKQSSMSDKIVKKIQSKNKPGGRTDAEQRVFDQHKAGKRRIENGTLPGKLTDSERKERRKRLNKPGVLTDAEKRVLDTAAKARHRIEKDKK